MNIVTFTVLLCSLLNQSQDCISRSNEYWIIGGKYRFDPILLVAISIYECDLSDKNNIRKYPADLCPMGLRISKRMNLTRYQIIDEATARLSYFSKITADHKESYPYLMHYNSGWKHVHNKYAWQVMAIYKTLYGFELNKIEKRNVNSRTKQIIQGINQNVFYLDYSIGIHN